MDKFKPINLAPTGRISGYYFNHLQLRIDTYHRDIAEICSKGDSALLKKLNSDKFWDTLSSLTTAQEAYDACRDSWKKIKPLAHLNTQELLSLLTDKVLPLEQLYSQAFQRLQLERQMRENNGFWPLNWFKASITKALAALEENQAQLASLKKMIHEGLFQRCKVHLALKAPRNVDDVLASLCEKVNELNILKEPLNIERNTLATLDDDRRLAIYDYLESTWNDKEELKDVVLSTIPKRSHISFKSKREIKSNLREMRKFRNDMLEGVADSSEKGKLQTIADRVVPAAVRKIGSETTSSLARILENIGLYSFLSHFWHLRFLLYFGLSYFSYHYLVITLQPMASLFLSASTVALLSSGLFYTLALAPIWWLGLICLKAVKDGIKEFLLLRKKSEICDSLYVLTQSQEFIANHLSQKIIDLAHFDIQNLSELVRHHQYLLEQSHSKLERFSFGERYLCKGNIQQVINQVKNRITSQQKYIETQLQELTCHIALRIGQEIDLLERSSSKLKLQPILPPEQLEKLRLFIWTFGDENALNQFKQNVNPINKWVRKIDRFYTPQDETEAPSLNQPWGGNSIRKDTLNGWHTLLTAFVLNPKQKDAALQLNAVLSGKLHPTLQQFQEMIRDLELGRKSNHVLQNIQGAIFATLNSKTIQNARLLSFHHKGLIGQWYHQNEERIKEAEKDISRFFDKVKRNPDDIEKYDDDYLNNMFELLEGAEIYAISRGLATAISKRHQIICQYFSEYSGETSRVIRFLRLIPSSDTNHLLVDVARKRLGWILKQARKDPKNSKLLSDTDIELFQDCSLIMGKEKLNFYDFVSQSTQFNQPWEPKFERFLRKCQRNGLDSGKLLKIYQSKNQRIKPFMLSKVEKSSSPATQVSRNSSEVIRRKAYRV